MKAKKWFLLTVAAAAMSVLVSGCSDGASILSGAARLSLAGNDLRITAGGDASGGLDLQYEVGDDGSVRLFWADTGEAGYTVARAGGGEPDELAELGGVTEYTDRPSAESYEYTYTVTGTSGVSDSAYVKNGFFLDNGYLTCYRGGEAVAGSEISGLRFGADGVYTSGDAELDAIVASVIEEHTGDYMTRLERLEVLYNWVIDEFEYEAIRFTDMNEGWELGYARDMFEEKAGNCYSFAAALTVLARGLGFEARGVTGSCHQLYEWVDHGWTEVVYEGETYLCDAEMEGEYAPERDLEWDLFMKKYGETPTIYEKYDENGET